MLGHGNVINQNGSSCENSSYSLSNSGRDVFATSINNNYLGSSINQISTNSPNSPSIKAITNQNNIVTNYTNNRLMHQNTSPPKQKNSVQNITGNLITANQSQFFTTASNIPIQSTKSTPSLFSTSGAQCFFSPPIKIISSINSAPINNQNNLTSTINNNNISPLTTQNLITQSHIADNLDNTTSRMSPFVACNNTNIIDKNLTNITPIGSLGNINTKNSSAFPSYNNLTEHGSYINNTDNFNKMSQINNFNDNGNTIFTVAQQNQTVPISSIFSSGTRQTLGPQIIFSATNNISPLHSKYSTNIIQSSSALGKTNIIKVGNTTTLNLDTNSNQNNGTVNPQISNVSSIVSIKSDDGLCINSNEPEAKESVKNNFGEVIKSVNESSKKPQEINLTKGSDNLFDTINGVSYSNDIYTLNTNILPNDKIKEEDLNNIEQNRNDLDNKKIEKVNDIKINKQSEKQIKKETSGKSKKISKKNTTTQEESLNYKALTDEEQTNSLKQNTTEDQQHKTDLVGELQQKKINNTSNTEIGTITMLNFLASTEPNFKSLPKYDLKLKNQDESEEDFINRCITNNTLEMRFLYRLKRLQAKFQRADFKKPPQVGHKSLNLLHLFLLISQKGGHSKIKSWKEIGILLSLPATVTNAGYLLRTKYELYILTFEKYLYAEFAPIIACFNSMKEFIAKPILTQIQDLFELYEEETKIFGYNPPDVKETLQFLILNETIAPLVIPSLKMTIRDYCISSCFDESIKDTASVDITDAFQTIIINDEAIETFINTKSQQIMPFEFTYNVNQGLNGSNKNIVVATSLTNTENYNKNSPISNNSYNNKCIISQSATCCDIHDTTDIEISKNVPQVSSPDSDNNNNNNNNNNNYIVTNTLNNKPDTVNTTDTNLMSIGPEHNLVPYSEQPKYTNISESKLHTFRWVGNMLTVEIFKTFMSSVKNLVELDISCHEFKSFPEASLFPKTLRKLTLRRVSMNFLKEVIYIYKSLEKCLESFNVNIDSEVNLNFNDFKTFSTTHYTDNSHTQLKNAIIKYREHAHPNEPNELSAENINALVTTNDINNQEETIILKNINNNNYQ